MPTEVENDPLFQLLTDALRAGPASPPWREAVAKLREDGQVAGRDEYRLLIEARENLEVGKAYRAVRAGPSFSRKVLTAVKESRQSGGGRRFPIAGMVALLAAIVLIGVVAYVSHLLVGAPASSGAVDELAATYFPTTVVAEEFDSYVLNTVRGIGALPLAVPGGMHLSKGTTSTDSKLGGGLFLPNALGSDEPFATEARIRPGGPGDQLAELFVSNSSDFSADRATAPHELVWLNRGQTQQVVLAGRVVADKPIPAGKDPLDVRIVMNRELAVVEVNHQRLWAGSHGLGDGNRYAGIRILTTSPGVVGAADEPVILQWKVLTK